jgi:serine/threonine-protein kinase HipA
MSMLGARDNETRSYLEIVDALRQHGAAAKEDVQGLWRRVVFNVLISNTDDHLRNHGFLYAGAGGWRLSPAYDLNPVPVDVKPRVLTTAINEDDATASLPVALSVAGYFELDDARARAVAAEVAQAVATWRDEAARQGLTQEENRAHGVRIRARRSHDGAVVRWKRISPTASENPIVTGVESPTSLALQEARPRR